MVFLNFYTIYAFVQIYMGKMVNLYDGDRITIDYLNEDNKYRISLFDNNYHYDMDFDLDEEQIIELRDALKALNLEETNL